MKTAFARLAHHAWAASFVTICAFSLSVIGFFIAAGVTSQHQPSSHDYPPLVTTSTSHRPSRTPVATTGQPDVTSTPATTAPQTTRQPGAQETIATVEPSASPHVMQPSQAPETSPTESAPTSDDRPAGQTPVPSQHAPVPTSVPSTDHRGSEEPTTVPTSHAPSNDVPGTTRPDPTRTPRPSDPTSPTVQPTTPTPSQAPSMSPSQPAPTQTPSVTPTGSPAPSAPAQPPLTDAELDGYFTCTRNGSSMNVRVHATPPAQHIESGTVRIVLVSTGQELTSVPLQDGQLKASSVKADQRTVRCDLAVQYRNGTSGHASKLVEGQPEPTAKATTTPGPTTVIEAPSATPTLPAPTQPSATPPQPEPTPSATVPPAPSPAPTAAATSAAAIAPTTLSGNG